MPKIHRDVVYDLPALQTRFYQDFTTSSTKELSHAGQTGSM